MNVLLFDTGPLGALSNPRRNTVSDDLKTRAVAWEQAGFSLAVPEIADYEVRRELLRAGQAQGLAELDVLTERYLYVPLNTEMMRRAALLWAQVRQSGQPTAHPQALDGDVILAAQSQWLSAQGANVTVVTTNPDHLQRFVVALEPENVSG